MPSRDYNAVVSEIMFVTSENMVLRVVPDGWDMSDYIPGQFATLGLPGVSPRIPLSDPESEEVDPDKFIVRAYSIASSSVQKKYLEFYITLVRSGGLTPRLFALTRGDRLHLGTKITGMFTLDRVPEKANVVLMATGTGVAPYMSMIRTFLNSESTRHFIVVHGAHHSWDLGYRSELATLSRMLPHFHYVPMISRPEEEITPWGGETGYVQEAWERGIIAEQWGLQPTPDNTHIFLCGNPAMIESAVEMLALDGFKEHTKKQPGQVHLERYW